MALNLIKQMRHILIAFLYFYKEKFALFWCLNSIVVELAIRQEEGCVLCMQAT